MVIADSNLPTIDIIIPALNEERYLGACLDSFLTQDYPPELLTVYVADDGSRDATVDVARQRKAVLLQLNEAGPGRARNFGIQQGQGQLLAFPDAHCIAPPDWCRVLAQNFSNPRIGACVSIFNNVCTDKRIAAFVSRTGLLSNQTVLESTLSGTHAPYPWINSGSAMYRRSAVEEAGLFTEDLIASEDLDLAWKVVLQGYHLAYSDQTAITHYDDNAWHRFLRKSRQYGQGIAQISYRYGLNVANRLDLPVLNRRELSIEWLLMFGYYWMGYYGMCRAIRSRQSSVPPYIYQPIPIERRPVFAWQTGQALQISQEVVFWHPDAHRVLIVHISKSIRLELEDVGKFIWQCLENEQSRQATLDRLIEQHPQADQQLSSDLDEIIAAFIEDKILLSLPPPSNEL